MTDSYARFRAVRFFGSLDGLRAFSIIGVVWFHSWWGTPYYPLLAKLPVLRLGEYGVHMFYFVSGFLITTLLLREKDRLGKVSLRDFYIRRTLRIWPLYYSVVALYVFVVLMFERSPQRSASFFHYLPSFLTFTYPWFLVPKWPGGIFNLASTLAVEEQFYAFWPVANRFLRGIGACALMAVLILLRTLTGYGYLAHWLPGDAFLTRVILSIAVPICMGAILAHGLHSERIFGLLYPLMGNKWTAPIAAVALLGSLAPRSPNYWLTWGFNVILIGACVVREDHGLSALLRFRPLAFVGVISYGMYLLNSLSIHLGQAVLSRMGLLHPALTFPVGLGVAVGVAYLSYRFLETPFLELKKKRFSPMANAQAVPGELVNSITAQVEARPVQSN
jgi:peptidoglycan/LPS O-acetylase OafA/YrhL